MEKHKSSVRYPPEVRARAVRMVLEHTGEHGSQWEAIGSIAGKIGCTSETLRKWVRPAERDQGFRPGPTSEERERISRPWKERTANYAKPMRFCERRRLILPRRSSTAGSSHDRVHRRSPRGVRGRADLQGSADRPMHLLCPRRTSGGSRQTPGPRATGCGAATCDPAGMGRELPSLRRAQGLAPAPPSGGRCGPLHDRTADARNGLVGAVRGKPRKTTVSNRAAPCPLDRVNRQFQASAPNALWLADFTYVATWQGFVYVAFIIDAFARRIVGWRVSRSARTDFVLDALEQALYARRPVGQGGLVHHGDRGVQGGFN
jgi:putative transposase